jgi:hypothetical protein
MNAVAGPPLINLGPPGWAPNYPSFNPVRFYSHSVLPETFPRASDIGRQA